MKTSDELELILGRVGKTKLPLPPLPNNIVNSLISLFIKGYGKAKSDYSSELMSSNEKVVGMGLKNGLRILRRNNPQFRRYFGEIQTEAEHFNFDGSNREVRPDFTIGLTDHSRLDFPILVEAKIIDGKGSDAMYEYCRKGLNRFLEGNYAWESKDGFMIAYVRNSYSLAGNFKDYLTSGKPPRHQRWKFIPNPAVLNFNSKHANSASSMHERFSSYFHDPATSPGPIEIWHIWLE